MSHTVILSTCPDIATAHQLAEGLLEKKLAACVNILPSMVSLYHWQGKIEQSSECQLIIKSCESKWTLIESYMEQHHPYDVPELLSIPVANGGQAYLQWLSANIE